MLTLAQGVLTGVYDQIALENGCYQLNSYQRHEKKYAVETEVFRFEDTWL